jgi:prevent-host-death family protein
MSLPALKPLDASPLTPASDVKKLGWRGVMQVVARNGKVVVTNHNKPEAVILPVEEYERLLRDAQSAMAQKQSQLDALSRAFDKRMDALRAPDAREKLRNILRRPTDFEGQIFTGDAF